MTAKRHVRLFLLAIGVWAAFWVAGLPSYYQQYPMLAIAIACILLSVAISLAAISGLRRGRSENMLERSVWLSVYFTIPFAILDTLYCGVYLGHGTAFLYRYWYLTIFYVTPWLTFIPTALLLRATGRTA
jgi:hypothetical protein